ncbi:MAG: L,D-transpeptidase [Desulfobacteraceae bacterium]|nr:L,D-transpeptidase [Desulfobacteraceae bacterium]
MTLLLTFSVTSALAADPSTAPKRVLVIDKAAQKLSVFVDGRQVARFPATFGIDPVSDKRRINDLATPEGHYFITYKKSRTRFYRTLGLSFPNLADAQRGLAAGIVSVEEYGRILKAARRSRPAPCDTGLGCAIAIHGGGVYRQFGEFTERDWTDGCVALDNSDMAVLFNLCRPGDPVLIFNSAQNLFGLIRPFTQVRNLDDQGLPVCPDGVCAYQADLRTRLGRTGVTVREGGAHGLSLEVVVQGEGANLPALVLVDRNADGEMSFLDSAEGPIADGAAPGSAYELVRTAIVAALSSGGMPRLDGGR